VNIYILLYSLKIYERHCIANRSREYDCTPFYLSRWVSRPGNFFSHYLLSALFTWIDLTLDNYKTKIMFYSIFSEFVTEQATW
jgi:hypothetical protein